MSRHVKIKDNRFACTFFATNEMSRSLYLITDVMFALTLLFRIAASARHTVVLQFFLTILHYHKKQNTISIVFHRGITNKSKQIFPLITL